MKPRVEHAHPPDPVQRTGRRSRIAGGERLESSRRRFGPVGKAGTAVKVPSALFCRHLLADENVGRERSDARDRPQQKDDGYGDEPDRAFGYGVPHDAECACNRACRSELGRNLRDSVASRRGRAAVRDWLPTFGGSTPGVRCCQDPPLSVLRGNSPSQRRSEPPPKLRARREADSAATPTRTPCFS
jgi:hypothetical protein